MFKKILLGLLCVVGALLVIVALQPAEFQITRSADIQAPPAVVFEQVNDFHKWQAWSPWAKRDPNATATFSGATTGKGARFAWAGNSEVGEGQMTIAESDPPELILIDLEFVKPMRSTCRAEFSFAPQGTDQTRVNWTMSGRRNFFCKSICIFLDMDKMIGGDFESGLAALKAAAEAELAPPVEPAGRAE